jgi:hypothetical protein
LFELPGLVAGIAVAVKIESLLNDDKKMKEFTKNAEKMVKK